MKKTLCLATLLFLGSAQAAPVFYTDRGLFEAQLNSFTTIDFEGIVADNSYSSLTSSMTIDNVTFSTSSGTLGVSGQSAGVSGAPYNSALLFSNNSGTLTADLTSAGSGFTAIGGFFGDIDSSGNSFTLSLFGSSGLLDTQSLTAADMGLGSPSMFYGWIVNSGDVTKVVHDLNGNFEGIDDLTFGVAGSAPAPVPAPMSIALLGLGLVGINFLRKKKTA